MSIRLHLLPTVMGENWELVPQKVKATASHLNCFVVENIRTARRHLRKMGNTMNFDEDVEFFILDKHQLSDEAIFHFLNNCITAKKDIGLLSEAGNPCIADPGARIVSMAHQLGIDVRPYVGPSSILMALIASGFNGQSFSFNGYLPIDNHEKKIVIRKMEQLVVQYNQTQIFMETPYRNEKMIESLLKYLRPETKLCVAVNIGEENEYISTRLVKNWKNRPNFHKQPAIFVIGN